MKQIARNVRVYSGEVHASQQELQNRLESAEFAECGATQTVSGGFIPVMDAVPESLVLAFDGGWVARFRRDTKAVPTNELAKAVEAKVEAVKAQTGRTPGRKERKELKDEARMDLLPRAFARSTTAYVLYSKARQRIYIATNSQKVADAVMTALVFCLKSLKTATVHVSEPKMGLTARLINWLDAADEQNAFGSFNPQNEVVMVSTGGRKWAVKSDSLLGASATIREAVAQGARVDSIGFMTEDDVQFRIDSDLRIKGVKHRIAFEKDDVDQQHAFVGQVISEVQTLNHIVDVMLDLLSPEKAQAGTDDDGLFD